MRKLLSVVLAVALCTGWSTAHAELTIKLDPDTIKLLKPPPKTRLARAAEIVTWSAAIVSGSASIVSTSVRFCHSWDPCDDAAAYVASVLHFKYPKRQ
jgi:hypothetical protein